MAKELSGKPIIDIHSHIIFDVDDGARDLDESLRMLEFAAAQGATAMILTPHYGIENGYDPSVSLIRDRFEQIRNHCDWLDLYLGCEVFGAPAAYDRVTHGKALTMAGTHYVLIEFAEWGENSESANIILERMRQWVAGPYFPVLAHAERYKNLHGREDLMLEMAQAGILFQVNAYDLAENKNEATRSMAQWLAKQQLINFIGSDGHREDHRPIALKNGVAWLYDHCPEDYADAVVYGNAKKMLESENHQQNLIP